jgi:eukaryotic-like serine/threonine-protein kinase
MFTGTRAYEGDDVTDTMAAILRGEPDWSRVPADVPPALVRVLKRCLEKDRRQRRHDIADVRMDIDDALSAQAGQAAGGGSGFRWSIRSVVAIAALIVAAAAIAGMIGWYARPDAPQMVRRFVIPLAQNETYSNAGRHMLALSPDGSHLVYVANARLNLRKLDQLAATAIQGTDAGAGREPFFSPDSQWIGFWAQGQLKRVPLTGGAPVPLAKIGNPFGASWSADDTILFGNAEGIWRVPGSGGTPEQVIKIKSGEVPHGPQLLPNGEHVLFTLRPAGVGTWDDANIVVQSLKTGERKTVIQRGRDARYVQTGHIVYATAGTLLAVRFDVAKLATIGGAVSLVENVPNAGNGSGASQFAVALNGTLAYIGGGAAAQRGTLVWVDRNGREDPMPVSAEIPGLEYPRLSPDGRSAALMSEGNLWVQDLHGRPPIKLTFDGGHYSPIWSFDGRRIFYEAATNIMSIASDASGQPEPASPPGHFHAYAVSRDGAEVIVVRLPDANVSQTTDILRLAPGPKAALQPVVVTPNQEGFDGFSLSPDGRWLAYTSQATGPSEVWVQPCSCVAKRRRRANLVEKRT